MPTLANHWSSPLRAGRWQMLVLVALVAAAGCSGTADTRSIPRSTQPPSATPGTGAAVPAFARDRFAAAIPVPGAGSLAVGDGKVWVLDGSGRVVGIDPVTNAAVGEPLRVPANAEAIAVGDGALWVASVAPGDLAAPHDDAVTRVDLATAAGWRPSQSAGAPWTSRPCPRLYG